MFNSEPRQGKDGELEQFLYKVSANPLSVGKFRRQGRLISLSNAASVAAFQGGVRVVIKR
jgi:hypothetical protein